MNVIHRTRVLCITALMICCLLCCTAGVGASSCVPSDGTGTIGTPGDWNAKIDADVVTDGLPQTVHIYVYQTGSFDGITTTAGSEMLVVDAVVTTTPDGAFTVTGLCRLFTYKLVVRSVNVPICESVENLHTEDLSSDVMTATFVEPLPRGGIVVPLVTN